MRSGRDAGLSAAEGISSDSDGPVGYAMGREESERLQDLLARLPYQQREVVVLHLHYGMRFRRMARALGVSINTVQSRYRYGLDKLRSILDSEVKK